jgi:hypothetical protein
MGMKDLGPDAAAKDNAQIAIAGQFREAVN